MPSNDTKKLAITARMILPDFRLNIDQEFTLSGVTGLFGTSGSGKSTLLRVIAGFEPTAAGRVAFAGEVWQDSSKNLYTKAHRRPVGLVFQDVRLFEHLTVEGNLQFANRRSTISDTKIDYDDVVSAFDLAELLHRNADGLSGGERQRVAIARTLLARPRLLLLDEPLAALDVGRKREILPYLETLAQQFDIPTIFVSHAVDEMARLAERVIVLSGGEVVATGDATDVLNRLDYQSPESRFESIAVIETTVIGHDTELLLTRLDLRGQTIVIPMLERIQTGTCIRLHVRAGDVALATRKPESISIRNVIEGTVAGIAAHDASAFCTVTVDIDGAILRAQLTRQSIADLSLAAGSRVFVLLKTATFDDRAAPS